MWSTRVYEWPAIEERLSSCSNRFALEVVRHGQTEANAGRRFSGASDVPLTDLGEQQARELGSKLGGPYDLAFHSPLARSRRTLELAIEAGGVRVGEVVEDDRLAERSLGVLEGLPSRPIPAYERGDFHWCPEGGETYASVTHRILSFLADLATVAGDRQEPLRALACTHVGPMRVLIPVLRGATDRDGILTAKYANADVFGFEPSGLVVPEFVREALHASALPPDGAG